MRAGREVQQMVCLSTIAEYVMSTDILQLAKVKVTEFPASDRPKLDAASAAVESEWLKETGADGQELLAAIRSALDGYRNFK
jgi:TRAP-type C4-dicarboxylate transport system substrate-binding protein